MDFSLNIFLKTQENLLANPYFGYIYISAYIATTAISSTTGDNFVTLLGVLKLYTLEIHGNFMVMNSV